jgi:hypothetical protein
MMLPWVAWRTATGEWRLSTWDGETRDIVLVGASDPVGHLSDDVLLYEIPPDRTAVDVAEESGGIVVKVFDRLEPFGPLWSGH